MKQKLIGVLLSMTMLAGLVFGTGMTVMAG